MNKTDPATQVEPGLEFKMRLHVFHALSVLLFPITIIVLICMWLVFGETPRDTYWGCRPRPRVGLRKLRKEEKWAYLESLEQKVAVLEAEAKSPEGLFRREMEQAMARIDFEAIIRPLLIDRMATVKAITPGPQSGVAEVVITAAGPEGRYSPLFATEADLERRPTAGAVELEAATPVQAVHVAATVGDAVAAAVEREYIPSGDAELDAAVARIRAGGGDTE